MVRAKIMLLPGSKIGEAVCSLAEQILIDVSAAFSHSFSLLRERIGDQSIAAYQEALTDETVEACKQCQAIMLGDGACKGSQELYDALDLPLRIRSFCIPEAFCSRHESPVSLWVAQALSIDDQTVRAAMRTAFRFAQESDAKITHVPPNGASKESWMGNIRVQEVSFPSLSTTALSGPEAITSLIAAPSRLGVMLCPPYAGSMLHAAAVALCTHPGMMYDVVFDDTIGIYAPILPIHLQSEEDINPFACALAVASMLRFSLHLPREAACVDAAVNNVLSAGWRTPNSARPGTQTASAFEIVDLICNQITVAGELMGKVGIR